MTLRRLLPLALLLVLLAPATAGAAAKHKVSKVRLSVTAGTQNALAVTQTVQARFAVPGGTTAGRACKGKLNFKAAIGTRSVKRNGKRVNQTIYAKRSGALAAGTGGCAASVTLTMSPPLLGKRIRYAVGFKGNAVIKAFVKTTKLKVQIPSAPLTPTPGAWIMQQTGVAPGAAQQWTFTVGPDGSVGALKRLTDLTVQCMGGSSVVVQAAPTEMLPFDTPFKITAADLFARDDTSTPSISTSTLTAHFDSPSHATGKFQITGAIGTPPTVYPGCDTGELAVELKPGSFS